MEEKNNIGEQPADSMPDNSATQAAVQPAVENTNGSQSAVENTNGNQLGSPIGKFKNADSLHGAYLQLEKEFTQKSQRLSQLEKAQEQDNAEKSTPYFQRENWREEVKGFLASNQNALQYASEISDELMKDSNLACLPNSLELAYSKVLASKFKSADDFANDSDFLEKKILTNNQIKERIIKEYLQGVSLKKTPPVVLNNHRSTVGFKVSEKPQDLQEAKKMVEKLFN